MEYQLTSDQERLQSLQEKSPFALLTREEQLFVLQHSTQAAFDQIHVLLKESKDLYSVPSPKALLIPVGKRYRLIRLLVPLTSAAAAALITFMFFRKETIVYRNVEHPVYVAADTVYIPQEKIDTVFNVIVQDGKTSSVEKRAPSISVRLSTPTTNERILPPISPVDLPNKGETIRNDNTIALIEGIGL